MRIAPPIILALDVYDRKRALDIASAVREYIGAVKINWPLVLGSGPGIIEELSSILPVICDFKVADIPNTNRLIAKKAFELGASAIIAHPFVGEDSFSALCDVAREYGTEVYAVVEMSHPGGREMFQPIVEKLIDIAISAGASGVIAPATRPERVEYIRSIVGPEVKILSPGVGAQGGDARKAIESGADAIIVGRAIYNTDDPAEAARKILESISPE